MKKNLLNKEEQLFKEKLEGMNFDYDPKDWDDLENKMSEGSASGWSASKAVIGAAAAVIIIGAAAYFYSQKSSTPTNDPVKQEELDLKTESKSEETPLIKNEIEDSRNQSANESKPFKAEPSKVAKKHAVSDPKESVEQDQDEQLADKKNNQATKSDIEHDSKAIQPEIESNFKLKELLAPDLICEHSKAEVEILYEGELPDDWNIKWYFDGQLYSDNSRITAFELDQLEAGVIKAEIIDENMSVVDEVSKEIKTYPPTVLDFTYEDQKDPYYDFFVEMKAEPSDLSNYQWKFKDGSIASKLNPAKINLQEKGSYAISLSALDHNGCNTEVSKVVNVRQDFDPLAPNAFTPDGDGLNDEFIPEAFALRNDRFKMEIYDLDGDLIFSTTDPEKGWNGQLNNSGQKMPNGVYVWKVFISNEEGLEKSYAGNFRKMMTE